MFARVFHSCTALLFFFCGVYSLFFLEIPPGVKPRTPNPWTNPWLYMTVWNSVLQGLYFASCAYDDALDAGRREAKQLGGAVERLRNWVYAALFVPSGLQVFVTYWPTFLWDRELVHPSTMDAVIPRWLNHINHTGIAVFVLLEVLLCPKHYPERRQGLKGAFSMNLAYMLCVVANYLALGTWPYPLFCQMTATEVANFIAASFAVMFVCYIVGEKINNWSLGEFSLRGLAKRELRVTPNNNNTDVNLNNNTLTLRNSVLVHKISK